RRAGFTSDRVDRLVDREDDVGDARRVAPMRQQIAATRPADALDEAAAPQLGEQLLEIGQRNLPPFRALGQADPPPVAVLGEIDHRHDRVATASTEPHARYLMPIYFTRGISRPPDARSRPPRRWRWGRRRAFSRFRAG